MQIVIREHGRFERLVEFRLVPQREDTHMLMDECGGFGVAIVLGDVGGEFGLPIAGDRDGKRLEFEISIHLIALFVIEGVFGFVDHWEHKDYVERDPFFHWGHQRDDPKEQPSQEWR